MDLTWQTQANISGFQLRMMFMGFGDEAGKCDWLERGDAAGRRARARRARRRAWVRPAPRGASGVAHAVAHSE